MSLRARASFSFSTRSAELGDHYRVVERAACCPGLGLRVLLPDKVGQRSIVGLANPVYPPQSAVDAVGPLAALPEETDLVPYITLGLQVTR